MPNKNEHGENFLELGFDWYILEHWSSVTNESKLQQHIRLGIEYARLGHQGRRRFIRSAHTHLFSPLVVFPSHNSAVPSDLLMPYERRINTHYTPTWIRTDYNPGTDIIHHSLLTSIPSNNILKHLEEGTILNNAERYSFLASQPLESIIAFVPLLVEFNSNLYVQHDEQVPWESEELQVQFMDRKEEGDSEEQKKHKIMVHQRSFFVADEEAMATGYVLWVHLDKFGNVVQKNRAQPLLFGALGGPDLRLSLGELGVGYEDGRLNAVRDQWGNLRPRLVRQPSNAQILDNLLALKTEQRFIA